LNIIPFLHQTTTKGEQSRMFKAFYSFFKMDKCSFYPHGSGMMYIFLFLF